MERPFSAPYFLALAGIPVAAVLRVWSLNAAVDALGLPVMHRSIYALLAAAAVFIVLGILPARSALGAINWNVLMMLAGTMATVELFIQSNMPARMAEKLLAAHRAGVKKVFIPAENVEDLRDVPDEVKNAIDVVPVSEVTELLTYAGILLTPKTRKAEPKQPETVSV